MRYYQKRPSTGSSATNNRWSSEEVVRRCEDGREVCMNNLAGRSEYDNRKQHLWSRQSGLCALDSCGLRMSLGECRMTGGDWEPRGQLRDDRIQLRDGQPVNGLVHKDCLRKWHEQQQSAIATSLTSPTSSTSPTSPIDIPSRRGMLAAALLMLLALFISFPTAARAQAAALSGQVVTPFGAPAASAKVLICPISAVGVPCSPHAALYSDFALTHQIPNPVSTDQYGNYKFFLASGTYNLQISLAGASQPTYIYYATASGTGDGGSCGPPANDDTSTTCGNNNRAGDTATLPATIQVYGYNNLGTNAGDHLIVAGNTNATGFNGEYGVVIGDNEAAYTSIDPEDPYRGAVFIGRNDIGGTTGGMGVGTCVISLGGVYIGDSNAKPCQGQTIVSTVMVGAGNFRQDAGMASPSAVMHQIVAIGIENGLQTGTNLLDRAQEVVLLGDQSAAQVSSMTDVVGIGNGTFAQATTGTTLSDSVAIGNGTGGNAEGSNLIFVGASSGINSNGTDIVGLGNTSGENIDTGDNIVGLGNTDATNIGTSSSDIIGIGDGSAAGLGANSADMIGIGEGATANMAASSSDVIGIGTGAANQHSPVGSPTSLTNIVAIGDGAGSSNSGSSEVVALGTLAATCNNAANIIAIGNIALGGLYGSGSCITSSTGVESIGIGDHALAANTSGMENVAIGKFSGANGYVSKTSIGNANSTGSHNTWIGAESGPAVTTQFSNTIALGFQAIPTASNQTVIGNPSTTEVIIYGIPDGCLSISGGIITGSGGACGGGGGGTAFSAITGSTNTTATMNVGTGASILPVGSGVIQATNIAGTIAQGTNVTITGSGTVASPYVINSSGGGSSAFNAITSGTNTTAAMIVGSGGSLNFSGSGTINASSLGGVALSGICQTGGAGCPAGGSSVWSALTDPTVTLSLNMAAHATIFGYGATTGSSDMMLWSDTASNTGTGILGHFHTASGSSEIPWQADFNGKGWKVDAATGNLVGVGSSSSHGMFIPGGTTLSPVAVNAGLSTDSSGNLFSSDAGAAFARVCNATNGVCGGGTGVLVASAEVVSFSATPTFSVAFNMSRIVLTGNITSFTMAAGADGQLKTLCFEQDSTGSRTVAPPANVHGFFTVGSTLSTWSCQGFAWDNTDSIWLSSGPGTINE